MNDKISRPAPRELTESLDASLRDIETGAVFDTEAVQHFARRMLADFQQAHSASSSARSGTSDILRNFRKQPE